MEIDLRAERTTIPWSIFKPGARRPQAGVRLVSRNHFRAAKVCVCVCVSTPEAINN